MAKSTNIDGGSTGEARPDGNNQRHLPDAGILIIIISIFAVFGRVVGQDFVHWDDRAHVFQNPYLARLTPAGLAHFWLHPYEHLYIPVSYMAFALLSRLARMPHLDPSVTVIETLFNPHVFHTANLILHAINALLVLAILRHLTRRDGASVIGALLFALHPLQVESVAWISELRGLLSGLFCLAATYCYLLAVGPPATAGSENPELPSLGRRGWRRFQPPGDKGRRIATRQPTYWIALILTALALLSKPTAVALPLALLAMDRWIIRRPLRDCLFTAIPWFALAAAFVAITAGVQAVSPHDGAAVWQRPFVAGDALAFYLVKLIAPLGLTIDYGRKPAVVMNAWWGYATWLLPAAVAALIAVSRRKRPWAVAAGLLALGYLLPVLGLAPFAFQHYSTVADRYVYLAMLGPALAVAMLLAEEGRGVRRAYGVSIAILAAFSLLTTLQVRHWDNSLTLFSHAVRLNPTSHGLRENYGVALDERGRYGDAIAQYQAEIRLNGQEPTAYNNLGVALSQQNRLAEAAAAFEKAVALDPNMAIGHRGLGMTLLKQGDAAAAANQLYTATTLAPQDPHIWTNYGMALQAGGRNTDAIAALRQALRLDPNIPEALAMLGDLLQRSGQSADATAAAAHAVQIAPQSARAHASLAEAYIQAGRINEGVAEYRRATALAPNDAALHFGLGHALFTKGDAPAAIPELAAAARLEPTPFNLDHLGIAYAVTNNMAAARAAFESELRLDPKSADARKHLAMLNHSAR